jgi:sterol desaturase/sphingolipid hydroxylase (fatty acid hydroxylase superfamily)
METHTESQKRFQYVIHGVHHEYPKDKTRQAMPPFISISIIFITLSVCRLLIGEYAFGFLSGFFVGYAGYLIVHYLIHAYPPPNNFFRFLWVNHAIHHYKDGQVVFGVITPFWDYVFGTMPEKSSRSTFKQHNFEQN